MVVFSFVNCGDGAGGGFCMGSHREVIGWQGLPHDLNREVEDVRRKGEKLVQLSSGLDGDWFLRTDRRLACKTELREGVSNVELFSRQIAQAGFSPEHYTIQFFTFVPDPTGYITVVHNTDNSVSRCAWNNVPHGLDQLLEREAINGIRLVTVGKNGSYVVILNSGAVRWSGVPEALSQLLQDAERMGRAVATVTLSLVADGWYFIEFADSATRFCLPPDWHDSVNRQTEGARQRERTTSDNWALAPSPRSPQHAANPAIPFASQSEITSLVYPTSQQSVYTTDVHKSPTSQEPVHTPQSTYTLPPAYAQELAHSPQQSVYVQQPAYSQHPVYAQQPASIAPVSSSRTLEQPRGPSITAKDVIAGIKLAHRTLKLATDIREAINDDD